MATAGLSQPQARREVTLTEHLICPGPVLGTKMFEASVLEDPKDRGTLAC